MYPEMTNTLRNASLPTNEDDGRQDLESFLQNLMTSQSSTSPSSSQYGLAAPGSFPHYKHVSWPPDQMEKILAMHEASRANAAIYVAIVLGVYIVLLSILLCRYSGGYFSILLLTSTTTADDRSMEEVEMDEGLPLTPPTPRLQVPQVYTSTKFGMVRIIQRPGEDDVEKQDNDDRRKSSVLSTNSNGKCVYMTQSCPPYPPLRKKKVNKKDTKVDSLPVRHLTPIRPTQKLVPRSPTVTSNRNNREDQIDDHHQKQQPMCNDATTTIVSVHCSLTSLPLPDLPTSESSGLPKT